MKGAPVDRPDAMKRKLAAHAPRQIRRPAVGADKAWPLALARAGRDCMALDMTITSLRAQRVSLAELLDMTPERPLIAVLEGPGEALGMIALSPDVLAALIEAQTLGRVTAQPAPPRKPTRTDAAMVAGFLDAGLSGLETSLFADPDLVWTDGFRYASFLDEPRPLGLLLDDVAYRLLMAEISFGDGLKSGQMMLALPALGYGRKPATQGVVAPDAAHAAEFAGAMEQQVMGSDCLLAAVLHRVTLPLSAVLELKPGDLLSVPATALETIVIEGGTGQLLARGKLGQHRGLRAVRLTQIGEKSDLAEKTVSQMRRRSTDNVEPEEKSGIPSPVPGNGADYLRTGT